MSQAKLTTSGKGAGAWRGPKSYRGANLILNDRARYLSLVGRRVLGWFHFRAMTIGAFDRCWFIEKNRFAVEHFRFPVTFVTRNVGMATGKRKVRPRVVIKRGRNPALNVVAHGASSFAFLRKLGAMDIGMAVLADL